MTPSRPKPETNIRWPILRSGVNCGAEKHEVIVAVQRKYLRQEYMHQVILAGAEDNGGLGMSLPVQKRDWMTQEYP